MFILLAFSSLVLLTVEHVNILDSVTRLQSLTSYEQASKDPLWIDFMNEELE